MTLILNLIKRVIFEKDHLNLNRIIFIFKIFYISFLFIYSKIKRIFIINIKINGKKAKKQRSTNKGQ